MLYNDQQKIEKYMKKILFLFAVLSISTLLEAATVEVSLKDGRTFQCSLVESSDTLLILSPMDGVVSTTMKITPDQVDHYIIDNSVRYNVVDGKFVRLDKTQQKAARAKHKSLGVSAANPNDVIAQAFKSTGSFCIGFGVPCAIAGGALLAVGLSQSSGSAMDQLKQADMKSKLQIAGCVLLPAGAAMTLVGIPLCVQGKRIAEFNFNYTGNGLGVAMSF